MVGHKLVTKGTDFAIHDQGFSIQVCDSEDVRITRPGHTLAPYYPNFGSQKQYFLPPIQPLMPDFH